ncbi:MAG TPA: hypothetical protein VNW71_18665 [Thermoanaerobaculia bacterium]|nr:hypothetical protein [Thermoanaerobaculia bacterium]
MAKPTKPNRAPSFADLFASKDEFEAARSAEITTPPPAAPAADATLHQLEDARSTGQLPSGFSMRKLGAEIAEAVGAKVVSEHEGLIDTLLITIPRQTAKPIDLLDARHYRALFSGLGNWVKYVVLCDPRQNEAVLSIAQHAGLPVENIRIVSSPRFDYSIWAQDAYVALNDSANSMILCEGVSFTRAEDMTIADDIVVQSDISLLQSYLYFQGGNVLCSEGRTLVGMDYIQRNVLRHNIPDADASVEAFSKQFGTPVVPLGGKKSGEYEWYEKEILSGYGSQPIFHIDMYVTPTGVKNSAGREIVFLGRPAKAREATGRYSDIGELNNDKYDSFFLETEEQLRAHYEVRHLPLWLTHGSLGYNTQPRYYNLTWNNCIVQNAPDEKRVLLPSYSPDAANNGGCEHLRRDLEASAQCEWEKLGFTVYWMDGIEDLAFGSGAVHCITKVLRRLTPKPN